MDLLWSPSGTKERRRVLSHRDQKLIPNILIWEVRYEEQFVRPQESQVRYYHPVEAEHPDERFSLRQNSRLELANIYGSIGCRIISTVADDS